jgi:hypothetical protein
MGQKKWQHKVAAIFAYLLCYHHMGEDGKNKEKFWKEFNTEFHRRAPEHDVSERRKFARKWVKRFEETGSIADRQRRKSKLTDADVRAIAVALGTPRPTFVTVRKWVGRGRWKHGVIQRVTRLQGYSSLKEFVHFNPKLVKAVHWKTVLRRLRQVKCPRRLVYKTVRPLKPLLPWHKSARKKFCLGLLSRIGIFIGGPESQIDYLLHYLYRVCWIDAKTYYVCPKTHKVWAFAGADTTEVDSRMDGNIKIVYYAAVNPILGPVYFELVTGTSEHALDPHYQQYMVGC